MPFIRPLYLSRILSRSLSESPEINYAFSDFPTLPYVETSSCEITFSYLISPSSDVYFSLTFLMDEEMAARYSTSPGSSSSVTSSEMTTLDSYEVDGRKYTPETTVELKDGSFLRIKNIVRQGDDDPLFRGWKFVRNRELGNLVPDERRWLNEVCCLVDLTPKESKGRVEIQEILIKPSEVKGTRALFMTNKPYPAFNIDNITDTSGLSRLHVKHEGPLICRLKYIRVDPRLISTGKHFHEQSIQNLALSECDDDQVFNDREIRCKADPAFLRESWRGNTVPGGEHRGGHSGIQRFTFGDGFCGGGGASCGARAAGVHNQWAFDSDENAVKTYRLNFPDAFVYWAQVQDFTAMGFDEVKVDIVHASNPCNTYSSGKSNGRCPRSAFRESC
jgi:DNA (cytosine-5)-methyltransferase 1